MDLVVIGMTLDVIGKVLLALLVFLVHYKMSKEKHIDDSVIKNIKIEIIVGVISIVLMIAGYVLKIIGK